MLRTTFITGFPGETDEQFAELVDFVRQQRFERLGVFTYSFEPDTPAARLPDHLPDEVKEVRRDELMARAAGNRFRVERGPGGPAARRAARSGRCPGRTGAWIGRTYADAPDVDSVVYVSGKGLRAGQFVPCEVVATQDTTW